MKLSSTVNHACSKFQSINYWFYSLLISCLFCFLLFSFFRNPPSSYSSNKNKSDHEVVTRRKQRRKRRKNKTKYPYIPESLIIYHVLSRLPVTSLMRFRCVCKSWNNLFIQPNPNFISMHFNYYCINVSTTSSSGLLVKNPIDQTYSIVSFDNNNKSNALQVKKTNLPKQQHNHDFSPLGSCHGIVLVSHWISFGVTETVLWNPVTLDFVTVKRNALNDVYRRLVEQYDGLTARSLHDFGFDPKTNEHKILEIFRYPLSNSQWKYRFGIYTLSTMSWRSLEYEEEEDVFMKVNISSVGLTINPGYSQNRFLYWLATVNNCRGEIILCFDMCEEVFRTMHLPEDVGVKGGKHHLTRTLVSWCDKSIALVDYNRSGPQTFDIWVMNEFGGEEPWRRLESVRPVSDDEGLEPLGFWKNGEFILQYKSRDWGYYDPGTRKVRNLGISGYFQIYKDSVLPLSGCNVSMIN